MKSTNIRMNLLLASTASAIMAASLLPASEAHAQTTPAAAAAAPAAPAAPAAVEEVVVTGTQIRGVAPVGSPIIAVGHQEIVDSGLNTTSDIIHDLPQVSSLGAGQNTIGANQAANLNINKANAINIRGIGVQATLTLLDGRRLAPGGPGAQLFDPSSIPTIALRSIDIVADGASATYGSDAVAGVANLVLRTNFEGIEADAHYGVANNYNTEKFDAIVGHRWDSGSLMLAAEYNRNNEVTEGQRLGYFNCNETAFGYANSCVAYGTPAGNITVPAGATIAAGKYGLPYNPTGAAVTVGQLSTTQNLFNPALDTTLIPQSERKSLVGNIQQHVNDHVKVWAEGYYTTNDIHFKNGQFQATATIPSTSPYFIPLGAGITSESTTFGLDQYTGAIIRQGYEHGYQAALGMDADLTKSFQLTAYYEYSGNDLQNNFGALNAIAEKAAFACTVPTVCFDPYGAAPGNAAAVATFLGSQSYNDHFNSHLVNAKIDGSLFTLPGGDVKIAVGGEAHRDSFFTYNTANTTGATLATVAVTTNTTVSRSVYSGYLEANVPLVGHGNALPLVQRLDIDIAGRYDRYSDVGGTTNPKVGINWKPSDDLTLHASYGTSFRAPNLCDINPLCSAAVITAPAYGVPFNVLTIVGGNSKIKPETATTYSLGSEYVPSWLPGSLFSINYFNIDYKNVITTPAATNPAVFAQPALYAKYVTLNPTQAQINAVTSLPFYTASAPFPVVAGSVGAIVDGTRQNAGEEMESGIDLAADYVWHNNLGRWNVGATASYIFEYKYAAVTGAPLVNDLNAANYPISFRGRGKLGWSNTDFGAILYVNYTGAYKVVQLLSSTQNQPVSAFTTLDTTLTYRLNFPSLGNMAKNVTFTIAVQNLLDTKPPVALVSTTAQFDSQAASALGRLATFGIHKAF